LGYLFVAYWPFLIAVLAAGVAVGWWSQDPHSADDMTAWLERGLDEQ
jgi:hypothetical protein